MRKSLALALTLLTFPALAADNGIIWTPGSGGTSRSKDVGVGVQVPGVFLTDQTGAFPGAFTNYGSAPSGLVPGVNAFITNTPAVTATLGAETTKVIGTTRTLGNIGAVVDFPGQNAASPANSWLIGGQFNTTPTTITTGNASPLQLDTNGNLLVNIKAGAAAGGTSSSFGSAFPATGTATGFTDGTNMVAGRVTTYGTAPTGFNALAVNAFVTNTNANGRATSANSSPVVPSAAPTAYHLVAAASNNATSVKASAATVMSCQLGNNSANIGYFKIYNKASAPAPATDNALLVFTGIVPGPAAGGGGSNFQFGPGGLALATGFAIAVVGGISDTDNTSVAASAFVVNCQYE